MNLLSATIDALRDGPKSKPQIEVYLAEVGYAPVSVNHSLRVLKQSGIIRHLRRGGRYVTSLYALENNNEQNTTHP